MRKTVQGTQAQSGKAVSMLPPAAPRRYGGSMSPPEILVDARGHRCPVPTLRLRRAMEHAPAGASVRLLADDPLARIDVPHFVGGTDWVLLAQDAEGDVLSFLVGRSVADFGA